jgi:peptide/nickel transport system substrate-binding protein
MLAALVGGCGRAPVPENAGNTNAVPRPAELLVSVRTEPQSFNRYTHSDATLEVVTFLTQAKLVRVNRATQEIEPWLAESWTQGADGRTYTLKLRPNVTFSDGHPFTADDVLFSFAAVYDEKAANLIRGDMLVEDKPLVVTAPSPDAVVITFPATFAPGLRLLDNMPMLPKHKLEAALKAGRFAEAWSLSAPLTDIVGLGPFVLTDFTPRQRLVFARNVRYFRRAGDGTALPALDRVVMEIVPDQDSQMLRVQTGQSDMTTNEARPEDYAGLKRASDAKRLQLFDLGVSLTSESFWINLRPGAFGNDPRAAWLQRDELRHAISAAVDRQVFVDTVFLGAGVPVFGPVTPANKKWYWAGMPQTPHDPVRAKELLAKIGLADRNADGTLEDAGGRVARFTLSIQKGRTSAERAGVVIRDELKKIGLTVDVAPLEGNALAQRLATGQGYEAGYFDLGFTDIDHGLNQGYWLSSGESHVWHLGQKRPATDWERRIDELMARHTGVLDEAERKKAFDEVQKIFAEHLPVINFAAPRIFVPVSNRVTNLMPAVLRPQLLWSPDSIAIKR